MTRCDWSGPICTTNKFPDKVTGWTLTFAGGHSVKLETAAVEQRDGQILIDGAPILPGETLTPTIDRGAEIVVRLGCSKRAGHRGRHGMTRWQRLLRRIRR